MLTISHHKWFVAFDTVLYILLQSVKLKKKIVFLYFYKYLGVIMSTVKIERNESYGKG